MSETFYSRFSLRKIYQNMDIPVKWWNLWNPYSGIFYPAFLKCFWVESYIYSLIAVHPWKQFCLWIIYWRKFFFDVNCQVLKFLEETKAQDKEIINTIAYTFKSKIINILLWTQPSYGWKLNIKQSS